MIYVESITIEEFRGIRNLSLDLRGKNYAICGPNGTGKSGIVDALEFALTGNISRLSGEGMGEITLRQHGPHVDKRNDPEKARVIVNIVIPSLNKKAKLERNLNNPTIANVTPNDADIIKVIDHVKEHPEIVLSRRQLIKYVLATPGKRNEEVQSLLHLNQVEQVRVNLQKIANSCEKQLPNLKSIVTQARDKLLRDLGISESSKEKILTAANTQRLILGLPALTDLNPSISLKDGLSTPPPTAPKRIPKSQALIDINAIRDSFKEINSEATSSIVVDVRNILTSISKDPMIEASLKREALYAAGLDLIEDNICPLCDKPWNLDELRRHVQDKIKHLKDVSQIRDDAKNKLSTLISGIRKVCASANALQDYGKLLTPQLNMAKLNSYCIDMRNIEVKLISFFPIMETISALSKMQADLKNVLDDIDMLEKAIIALPEPTKQDAAKEWLIIAQERFETFIDAVHNYKIACDQAVRADLPPFSDHYELEYSNTLTG